MKPLLAPEVSLYRRNRAAAELINALASGRGARKLNNNSTTTASKASNEDTKTARKVARMERNRRMLARSAKLSRLTDTVTAEAAQVSRDRKKEYVETLEARIRELEEQLVAQSSEGSEAPVKSPEPLDYSASSPSPRPVFTLSTEADDVTCLKQENSDLRAALAKEQSDRLALWQRFDSLESKFEAFFTTQRTPNQSSSSPAPSTNATLVPNQQQETVGTPLVARERSSLPRKLPTTSCLLPTTSHQPLHPLSPSPQSRPNPTLKLQLPVSRPISMSTLCGILTAFLHRLQSRNNSRLYHQPGQTRSSQQPLKPASRRTSPLHHPPPRSMPQLRLKNQGLKQTTSTSLTLSRSMPLLQRLLSTTTGRQWLMHLQRSSISRQRKQAIIKSLLCASKRSHYR